MQCHFNACRFDTFIVIKIMFFINLQSTSHQHLTINDKTLPGPRPYAGNFQQGGSGCCSTHGEVSQREKKMGSGICPGKYLFASLANTVEKLA